LSRRARQVATALLLIVGVQLWLLVSHGNYGLTIQLKLLLAAFVLALISPVARAFTAALHSLRHPSPRARTIIAFSVALLTTAFVIFIARAQQRSFQPQYHDEFSYLIQ